MLLLSSEQFHRHGDEKSHPIVTLGGTNANRSSCDLRALDNRAGVLCIVRYQRTQPMTAMQSTRRNRVTSRQILVDRNRVVPG